MPPPPPTPPPTPSPTPPKTVCVLHLKELILCPTPTPIPPPPPTIHLNVHVEFDRGIVLGSSEGCADMPQWRHFTHDIILHMTSFYTWHHFTHGLFWTDPSAMLSFQETFSTTTPLQKWGTLTNVLTDTNSKLYEKLVVGNAPSFFFFWK